VDTIRPILLAVAALGVTALLAGPAVSVVGIGDPIVIPPPAGSMRTPDGVPAESLGHRELADSVSFAVLRLGPGCIPAWGSDQQPDAEVLLLPDRTGYTVWTQFRKEAGDYAYSMGVAPESDVLDCASRLRALPAGARSGAFVHPARVLVLLGRGAGFAVNPPTGLVIPDRLMTDDDGTLKRAIALLLGFVRFAQTPATASAYHVAQVRAYMLWNSRRTE
jgi:hypothetical protein